MPYRQNFPIPDVIDPPKMCLQIWIPNHPDWKAVVSGLLFEPSYWFNWERTGDTSGAQCAAVWKQVYSSIDWGSMSCCCEEQVIIKRINPETGLVEQSSDNGATWSPEPGGLQSVIVKPIPPVTSGVAATKCDAATNVSGQVQVWIDQVSNDFTTAVSLLEFGAAVLEAILIAVITILSAGTLTAVEALVLPTIAAALYAAWGAGKSIFDAYWTTDVKDQILCAAYCNISPNGSYTDAQFSAFWAKLNGDLPPGPAKMLFMGFLSSVGTAGLNAMAASGMSADSDCSDCDCGFCAVEWTFYHVTDIVHDPDNDNHWTMTVDSSGDFAFTSGDMSVGCYFNPITGAGGTYSSWGLGSPTPNGVNPKTNRIWNYDTNSITPGTMLDVVFSSDPIP